MEVGLSQRAIFHGRFRLLERAAAATLGAADRLEKISMERNTVDYGPAVAVEFAVERITATAGHTLRGGSGASCCGLARVGDGQEIAGAYCKKRENDWCVASRLIGAGDAEIAQLYQ